MVGVRHFLTVIGFVGFAMAGWLLGGWVGAVVGIVVNWIVIGIPVVWYEERLAKKWRLRKQGWLGPFFGDFQASERHDEWERASARLEPGLAVTGKVVHKEHGYVYADIGCGFPALLTVSRVPSKGSMGHPPETWDDVLPAPGEEFAAWVRKLHHGEREVRLTQCE